MGSSSSCLRVLTVVQVQTAVSPASPGGKPDGRHGETQPALHNTPGAATKSAFGSKWVSSLALMPGIDKTELHLPISEREVFSLLKSWRLIKDVMADAGVTMFLRMFETAPAVQATFEKFRTMDEVTDLRESSVLFTHGLVVMSAMDEILMNLDDREYLIDLILEQGSSHARFGELTEGVFSAIEEPFLFALHKTLAADSLTPGLHELYSRTIHFVIEVMAMGFRHTREEMAAEAEQRRQRRRMEHGMMAVTANPGTTAGALPEVTG